MLFKRVMPKSRRGRVSFQGCGEWKQMWVGRKAVCSRTLERV